MENGMWNNELGDLKQMAEQNARAYQLQGLAADAVKETLANLQAQQNVVPSIDEAQVAVNYEPADIPADQKAQLIIAKYKIVFDELMNQFEKEIVGAYAIDDASKEEAPVYSLH